jgi:hypothetical protein
MKDVCPRDAVRVLIPGRVRNRLSTAWEALKLRHRALVAKVRDYGVRDFLDRREAYVDLPWEVFLVADKLFRAMIDCTSDIRADLRGNAPVCLPPWSEETGYFESRFALSEYMAMHTFAYSEEDNAVPVAQRNAADNLVPLALPRDGLMAVRDLAPMFTYDGVSVHAPLARFLDGAFPGRVIMVPVKVRAVCRAIFIRERDARARLVRTLVIGGCMCSGQCGHKSGREARTINLTDEDLWGRHNVTFDAFKIDVAPAARQTIFNESKVEALRQFLDAEIARTPGSGAGIVYNIYNIAQP